jgi:hypothetical protein
MIGTRSTVVRAHTSLVRGTSRRSRYDERVGHQSAEREFRKPEACGSRRGVSAVIPETALFSRLAVFPGSGCMPSNCNCVETHRDLRSVRLTHGTTAAGADMRRRRADGHPHADSRTPPVLQDCRIHAPPSTVDDDIDLVPQSRRPCDYLTPMLREVPRNVFVQRAQDTSIVPRTSWV